MRLNVRSSKMRSSSSDSCRFCLTSVSLPIACSSAARALVAAASAACSRAAGSPSSRNASRCAVSFARCAWYWPRLRRATSVRSARSSARANRSARRRSARGSTRRHRSSSRAAAWHGSPSSASDQIQPSRPEAVSAWDSTTRRNAAAVSASCAPCACRPWRSVSRRRDRSRSASRAVTSCASSSTCAASVPAPFAPRRGPGDGVARPAQPLADWSPLARLRRSSAARAHAQRPVLVAHASVPAPRGPARTPRRRRSIVAGRSSPVSPLS